MRAKEVRLTKREAEVLMSGIELAVSEFGTPDCPKCEKAFWSAIKKIDATFSLGVLSDES